MGGARAGRDGCGRSPLPDGVLPGVFQPGTVKAIVGTGRWGNASGAAGAELQSYRGRDGRPTTVPSL